MYMVLAILGLGFNEAAYLAEIIRAGISSVPEGQSEASTALGMSWLLTMRRTVLPQAMRVIIPPTGNEFIGQLKTTSLAVAVPFTLDLFGRQRDIAAVIFQPIPLLLVAAAWYLLITSILMVGQFYLERYFSRGAWRGLTAGESGAVAGGARTLKKMKQAHDRCGGRRPADGQGRTRLQELRGAGGPQGRLAGDRPRPGDVLFGPSGSGEGTLLR